MSQKKPRAEDLVVDREKMDEAMAQAARDAHRLHKQAGLPIVVWRDGKVVWVPPEEIRLDETRPTDQRRSGDSDL